MIKKDVIDLFSKDLDTLPVQERLKFYSRKGDIYNDLLHAVRFNEDISKVPKEYHTLLKQLIEKVEKDNQRQKVKEWKMKIKNYHLSREMRAQMRAADKEQTPGNDFDSQISSARKKVKKVADIIREVTKDGQILVDFLMGILNDTNEKGVRLKVGYRASDKMKAMDLLLKYGFSPPPIETLNKNENYNMSYLDLLKKQGMEVEVQTQEEIEKPTDAPMDN